MCYKLFKTVRVKDTPEIGLFRESKNHDVLVTIGEHEQYFNYSDIIAILIEMKAVSSGQVLMDVLSNNIIKFVNELIKLEQKVTIN